MATTYKINIVFTRSKSLFSNYLDTYRPGKFWLAGTDLAAENEWLWLPSQALVDEFTDWATGEPNNKGGYEHCMVLDMHREMQWRDDVCEENRNFVCERPMEDETVIG